MKKNFVALFANSFSDFDAFAVSAVRKDHANCVNRFSVIRRQVVGVVSVPVNHYNVRCRRNFFQKILLQVGGNVIKNGADLVCFVFEPAAFDYVDVSVLHFFYNAFDGRDTEF